MTALRERMIEDLQLRGTSANTQQAYLRAVRRLAEYHRKPPDRISEEELRQYFLYLKNERVVSAASFQIALCGIKFFYQFTLKRVWPILNLVRPPREKKLPVVLSLEEVCRILSAIRRMHYRACLTTIYSCGLRRQEGLNLKVGDIDSARMMLHVRSGKGAKDRYVPLPQRTLDLLRSYWVTHRNPTWIFPITKPPDLVSIANAARPMHSSGMHRAFKVALIDSGIQKPATIHTLRHSYATHLLEEGINLRLLQSYLGHTSLSYTSHYTHLTRKLETQSLETINQMLERVAW
jgi:site-specific recombinase XerD